MNLNGKCLGYNKKSFLFFIVVAILAGLFFFSGAKYERYRLGVLGKLCLNTAIPIELRGFLEAKNERTLKIKMENGENKDIYCPETTAFGESKKGTIDDLLVGQLLLIVGKKNPDGTITPEYIRKSKRSPKIPAPVPNNFQ